LVFGQDLKTDKTGWIYGGTKQYSVLEKSSLIEKLDKKLLKKPVIEEMLKKNSLINLSSIALAYGATVPPQRHTSNIETVSTVSQIILYVIYFAFVLVGMFCRFWFDRTSNESFWNLREITRPWAISPLVFIPLAGVLEIYAKTPTESIYQLIAPLFIFWENGFFWEKVYEERLKRFHG
jgi:hypothetical protein